MFLDLENDAEKPIAVLSSENLDDKQRELILLSIWYLLVVEYRAGFTNGKLAGMPVKSEEFQKANKLPNTAIGGKPSLTALSVEILQGKQRFTGRQTKNKQERKL